MKKTNKITGSALVLSLVFGLVSSFSADAASDPGLGAAASFSVVAQTSITNVPTSSISGDVGINSSGAGISGLTTGEVAGTIYATDLVAPSEGILSPTVQADLSTAYTTNIPGQGSDGSIGPVLDALVVTTGVYDIGAGRLNGGVLTLDGPGIYIFRASSDLISSGSINLINGARACDVYWRVQTLATINGSSFAGSILAGTGVHFGANVALDGRALAVGGDVTMISNTISGPSCASPTGTLRVVKTVVNDDAGTAVPSDANIHVKLDGTDVALSPQPGAVSPGTAYVLSAGTYVVSEDPLAGYTVSFSGACAADGTVILAGGEDLTCTVTNNDVTPPPPEQATLRVIKTVVNDNVGTAVPSDANIHVKLDGTDVVLSPQPGAVSPGTAYTLDAGTYVVSEDPLPGYGVSFSGACDVSGNVTLLSGTDVTCTITNDDQIVVIPPGGGSSFQGTAAGTINVVKVVVNDSGRTNTIADFPLFVNGIAVVSGVTNTFFPSAAYDVTETSDLSLYTRTFSGDCDVNGRLSLNAGENKFCIITNNDIGAPVVPPPVPPLIDVVKVPNPLALPGGPGGVEYTYTLRNVGTVPVTTITMVGDSCSPVVLVSGDLNNDSVLQVDETWVYTCSTTLTETHTNVVTATGWANGISAVDIASATVVVGVPLVPPLIHVTKVPSPLALSTGGGLVTYTERITNPGVVPLANVVLTDDKCSPLTRVSGDVNGDSLLDPSETWTYTCQSTLTQTTTNTAVATGEANGFVVRDLAIATVVVATSLVPGLPDTGFGPVENVVAYTIGVLAALLLLYAFRKKQNA